MNKPLVSVIVQTYNQEHFIRQCLDSIVNQKTSFSFEIIIGEDESNDTTRNICTEFADKYPELIKLYLRKREDVIRINNIATGRFNLISNLKAAKGKYIAICEGDDYWTDQEKLQKQVAVLEQAEDVAICYHNCTVQLEDTIQDDTLTRQISDGTIQDLATGNFIHTPSVMFRNDFEIPSWFNKVLLGDWSLYLHNLGERRIVKLEDVMAVYRVHNSSMYSSLKREKQLSGSISTMKVLLTESGLPINVKKIISSYRLKLLKHLKYSSISYYCRYLSQKYFNYPL